ncbi:hypothetical protein L873DRAFT_113043 [Choiromyces venosus 120613-1]|uniref:Uncharacterized protein n=1 Tax=Choiromyces venosus 120613-1 TaxID=1336337 RepID=A0A3N4JGU5_9PEZI|nr:hypothetical protein L873DRAFT_113043 [Choiromyces venosus 120613-1]
MLVSITSRIWCQAVGHMLRDLELLACYTILVGTLGNVMGHYVMAVECHITKQSNSQDASTILEERKSQKPPTPDSHKFPHPDTDVILLTQTNL